MKLPIWQIFLVVGALGLCAFSFWVLAGAKVDNLKEEVPSSVMYDKDSDISIKRYYDKNGKRTCYFATQNRQLIALDCK